MSKNSVMTAEFPRIFQISAYNKKSFKLYALQTYTLIDPCKI
jgi:hypothetical protein